METLGLPSKFIGFIFTIATPSNVFYISFLLDFLLPDWPVHRRIQDIHFKNDDHSISTMKMILKSERKLPDIKQQSF